MDTQPTDPTGSPDLSLVLACHNEETILEESVGRILGTLEGARLSWEVIFVEDASRDRTRRVLGRILDVRRDGRLRAVLHDRNTGRGAAVSDGFRAARGSIVGFIDVDLEVGPETILPCLEAIRAGADVALGRRAFGFSLRGAWRYVLSKGYARLARALLPIGSVTDSETGYKFFRRETAMALLDRVRDPGWFWDTEIVVRAVEAGCRIAEVPCVYVRNHLKRSTVRTVHDSAVYFLRLMAFRRVLRAEARSRETEAWWRERGGSFSGHYGARGPFSGFVGAFLDRRARLVDGWVKVRPGARALDAGCGHGLHLAVLAAGGAVVTGVDVSPAMLDRSRRALDAAGGGGELVAGRIESVDLPAASFDLVLAIGLLDYSGDWRRVLARLSGWTKPGGRVVFTVPKRPSPFWFLRIGPGLWMRRALFELPPILVAVTRAELEGAARAAGLVIEEVASCSGTMWAVRATKP